MLTWLIEIALVDCAGMGGASITLGEFGLGGLEFGVV